MVNWTQHLARRNRRWYAELRINGFGLPLTDAQLAEAPIDNDPRLRWCVARPPWTAESTAPYLWEQVVGLPLPTLLAEDGDALGGLPSFTSGITAVFTDLGKAFTSRFKPDAIPTAHLTSPITATDEVLSTGLGLADGQLIWVDDECIRIDSVEEAGDSATPAEYGVTRGWAGTKAEAHEKGVDVLVRNGRLLDRGLELWLGPTDGGPEDLRCLARGTITSATPDTWCIQWTITANCDAKQRLSRKSQGVARGLVLTQDVGLDGRVTGTPFGPVVPSELGQVNGFVVQWPGDQKRSPHFYAQAPDGEVIGLDQSENGGLVVQARDLLGVGGFGELKAGTTLTQCFFGNSYRNSPAAEGPETGAAGMGATSGWTEERHVVDLFLTIATSPSRVEDPIADNPLPTGNWSVLPGGYGLGVLAEDIDEESCAAVKRQRPDLVMDLAVWGGNDTRAPHEVLHEVLRGAGIRLHTVDRLSLSVVSMPLASDSLPVLDASTIIAETGEGKDTRVPRVTGMAVARGKFGLVTIEAGPQKRRTEIKVRGAQDTTIPLPWVLNDAPFVAHLEGRAAQLGRDAMEISVEVSPSVFFDLTWGSQVVYDYPTPLSMADDLPPVERQGEVLGIRLQQDKIFGVIGVVRLRLYPQFQLTSLIGPAAVLEDVASAPVFEVSVQDYSLPDGGTNDGGQFAVGDVLALYNGDGTRVGTDTETVVGFTPPVTLELSGDFSGAAAEGMHVAYAPWDEATANAVRDLYLFFSSVITRSPSAGAADPYIWGTP
jgi:hypothetical protein